MSRELKNVKSSLKGSQATLTSRLRRTTENQLDKAERARRESEDERLSRLLSSFQHRKSLTDIDATSASSPTEEPPGRQLPADPLQPVPPKRENNQDSLAQHCGSRGTQPVDPLVSRGNSLAEFLYYHSAAPTSPGCFLVSVVPVVRDRQVVVVLAVLPLATTRSWHQCLSTTFCAETTIEALTDVRLLTPFLPSRPCLTDFQWSFEDATLMLLVSPSVISLNFSTHGS